MADSTETITGAEGESRGMPGQRNSLRLRTAWHRARSAASLLALLSCVTAATGTATSPASAGAVAAGIVEPVPAVSGNVSAVILPSPLPTTQCVQQLGVRCYSPLQYRVAYDLNELYRDRITGAGRTIVVVDSFGSPTVQHDLDVFDAMWGLPATEVDIVRAGAIPPFDPGNPDMRSWANESTLDVEYAHAMAPDARIMLVETPVDETEGVTGFPEMMTAEKQLIDAGVGDVISQSFGTAEASFPGVDQGSYTSLLVLRYAFEAAARHHVAVLAASGDQGAGTYLADGSLTRGVNWPASDPLVIAVGGTRLDLDDSGARLGPDSVWNDGGGAGGGGLSSVFERPAFQDRVKGVVGDQRGLPDVSASAAHDGGAWVYTSYDAAHTGWRIFGGTSEATPLFAAVIALADQAAGHRVANVDETLYRLAATRCATDSGIVDITNGDNNYQTIAGYSAAPGYDLASGLGTFDAAALVRALAHQSDQ